MQNLVTKKEGSRSNSKKLCKQRNRTIDFALRLIATSRDYQETEINEWPFTGLRIIEEYELEIIEA